MPSMGKDVVLSVLISPLKEKKVPNLEVPFPGKRANLHKKKTQIESDPRIQSVFECGPPILLDTLRFLRHPASLTQVSKEVELRSSMCDLVT